MEEDDKKTEDQILSSEDAEKLADSLNDRESAAATYERFLENAKAHEANARVVHPKEIAEIMAAEFQAGNQKDGMKKPADLTAIKKIAEVIEKTPAFGEMMKDPKTLELVKQGNTKELKNSLLAHQLKLEEPAKQKVEPEKQKVEPAKQKVEPAKQKVEPDKKKTEPEKKAGGIGRK